MPIIDSGKHLCESCGKEFSWSFFEFTRQKSSDHMVVEELPDIVLAHTYNKVSDGTVEVSVNCPKCGYDNRFAKK